MRKIVILGSTGSIGTQTLEVVKAYPNDFQIIGLSANKNAALFRRQIKEFKPQYSVLADGEKYPSEALCRLAAAKEADIVVNALAGAAGLLPTYEACKAGKRIALANKESLVMAGELIMKEAQKTGATIIPIDSELSAVFRVLNEKRAAEKVETIILTASGGPFWKWPKEKLRTVTPAQALRHPTWQMGKKVTIDSATLINKAFEIIETHYLFDIPADRIKAVVHPQSLVHALVQFKDGNIEAVLSSRDMKIPISYALFYPDVKKNELPRINFSKLHLTFEKPDYATLRGPLFAYEVLKRGGIMPAVFCMADEIAVENFLNGKIPFLGIYDFIKRILDGTKDAPFAMAGILQTKNRKDRMNGADTIRNFKEILTSTS